jgi:putative endopeptidase
MATTILYAFETKNINCHTILTKANMKKIFLYTGLLLAATACNNEANNNHSDILTTNLDTTVNPATDFFSYANGGWIKKNPIPGEQSSWGIGNVVIEENLKRLRTIAEKAAAAKAPQGSSEQKIGDFWSTAMDSAAIESAGLKPLQPYFDKIDRITDIKSLLATVIELKKIGSSNLFNSSVTQDDKNSEKMIYQLSQGGIGLPEREYYFKQDASTIEIRAAYVKYITRMLTMAGDDSVTAATAAKNILSLETRLAKVSRKIEDLRNPHANYNIFAIKDLDKLGTIIQWKTFLDATGVKHIDSILVGQPEFFTTLSALLPVIPINDWKSYVKFNLLNDFSSSLPDRFGAESFSFQKLFSGARERRPRWKRAVSNIEGVMGELLGSLYVKEFFNEKTKKRYEDLTENIREALKDRIGKLTWMSDTTKQKAYAKLAAMTKKVGYPDKWKDFSAMQIGRESYVQNFINANIWLNKSQLDKLGKPVDRTEWGMLPQDYNAGYFPFDNAITLPAGIFTVPGSRDEELDDALVYGYAGASTIGHEITHGFDDQGRQYDAKGNLVSWWTKSDETEFNKRAEVMVKQFNAYEPVKGYYINGKATLGENIGDLGGVLLGIEAFKKTKQYKEGQKINGLTPMQRYFLGYALGWLGQQRDEALRNRLLSDVHSPGKYRVNGPFANVDEFYSAFNIKPGDGMYRPDSLRVKIW